MKNKFCLIAFLALNLMLSCKKEVQTQLSYSEKISLNQEDEQRNAFAKILAKALADKNVRKFIKEEASNKFDNDYDVLFELVKDREVTPGLSFSKYLYSLSSEDQIEKIHKSLPLLTILVPELSKFANYNWNVDSQIPLVAVVNSDHKERKGEKMIAFDSNGKQYELETTTEPKGPVVVVKDNERIVSEKNLFRSLTRGQLAFKEDNNSFYFLDNNFNHATTAIHTTESIKKTFISPRLKDAYNLHAASQRDYVYYNILNTNDRGPIDYNYAEYITDISYNDINADSRIYDDPTSDWSDGSLEFQIDIMFFNGSSALSKVSKVIDVPRSSLIFTNQGGQKSAVWYQLPNPIMITTWDEEKMGDQWLYSVTELDPGTVTTQTKTHSSKFGANFQFDINLGKKVKIGIGLSGETTSTNSTQIQITTGSDFCGDAIVSFMRPIVTNYGTSILHPEGQYTLEEANTGSIKLAIQPR